MSAAAKARLTARVAEAARAVVESIEAETLRRDGVTTVQLHPRANLTELRVSLRALEALEAAMEEADHG